jgi:hypothetical protein
MASIAEYLSNLYGTDQMTLADGIDKVNTIASAAILFFQENNVSFTAADVMLYVEQVMEATETE